VSIDAVMPPNRAEPLLECVPNVSEGRRPQVVQALAAAVRAPGVRLLDISSDSDHNRTVLTLAGPPEALHEGVLALFGVALEHIDLRRHQGVHPRLGAVDVVPFVPLAGTEMGTAVAAAHRLGEAVAARFRLPVFLYGEAAATGRPALADLRRAGLEGLAGRLDLPGWAPDFGPRRLHPTAGASAVGARYFLVAVNVQLATSDSRPACAIARAVRESSGGLPGVQALGLALPIRGCAQVSMNLVDYRRTSLAALLGRVMELAAAAGVAVAGTEIVGLVPEGALSGGSRSLAAPGGAAAGKVLERRLAEADRVAG
jgi:glutamate formiminotransferase